MLHHRVLKIDTRLKVIARINPQLWMERLQQPAPDQTASSGEMKIVIEGGLPDDDELPSTPDTEI